MYSFMLVVWEFNPDVLYYIASINLWMLIPAACSANMGE